MTQQTIGNTVYRVGQMIPPHELFNLPNGAILEKCESTQPEQRCYLEITALPNPDHVAEDWREVVLCDPSNIVNNAYVLPQGGVRPTAFIILQLAVQEVCMADEVKLEYPKDYFDRPIYCNVKPRPLRDVQDIALCFFLGGRVFVKGGV